MKVSIRKVSTKEAEEVQICCREITPEVRDIYTYVQNKGTELLGLEDGVRCIFKLEDVLYFEAVDEKVFAYTKEHVYEMKMRLYEVEEAYASYYFIRCSKSIVINLMLLQGISPALNGRFWAHLQNGEKIVINRSYVPMLRKAIAEKAGE